MTARIDSPIGTTSIDGTPISSADLARIAAEEAMHVEQQCNAVVVVAGCAQDAADCRTLLAMLGLSEEVAAQARAQLTSAAKRPRKGRAAA
jgi:electron transfer flavoprotein alpha/beta subunit